MKVLLGGRRGYTTGGFGGERKMQGGDAGFVILELVWMVIFFLEVLKYPARLVT